MTDKPLHVRVAEKLGCMPKLHEFVPGFWECGCPGWIHGEVGECGKSECLLEYDTSWSATGPIIERLGITVTPAAFDGQPKWTAVSGIAANENGVYVSIEDGALCVQAFGNTPLLAVCALLLALPDEVVRG